MNEYELGLAALQKGDITGAVRWLERAERDGRALFLLGRIEGDKEDGECDYQLAFRFFRAAADLDNDQAAYSIGVMYSMGAGVEPDAAEAFAWFKRSAELGSADGYRAIGLMYANGQGVSPNLDKAEAAWLSAIDLGQSDALVDLARLYSKRQDSVKSANFYLRAAGAGHSEIIQDLLNLCPSLKKGLADSGNVCARTFLGVIFMTYVDAPEQTVELLSQSSADGDPVAQRTLGYIFRERPGCGA